MSDNIKVAVRMRNLISREKDKEATVYWVAKNSTTISQNNAPSSFSYDRVFAGHENNNVVYSEFCSPIVKSVVSGFNGTIFAYGQTSSGKTYTIMGDEQNPGIAYHTVMELFAQIQNMPDREFLLRVSFMEIYNETVKDLLTSSGENLKLHEDQYGNIKVHKLTETIVQEPDQVLELMKQGQRQRKTGETKQNDKSSRSHFIFRMIIESGLSGNLNAAVNVSHFNFVDLAGSEKVSLNAPNALRFKEGVNINVSLFMLGQVISQLSSGKEHQFINYRDSKLTRILQNSLGGNALTAIICTVTPASLEETLSTLKFALRAKKIKNKPQVNEILTEQAMLKKLANERKRLTEELEATKKEKNQEEKRLKELQQKIENLKKKFVTHIAPEKFVQRSSRRETWGGCLDMARMKMMFSSNSSAIFPIENSTQDLSDQNFSIKPKKQGNRSTISGVNNMSMLEEEPEMDLISETDEFYDVERFRERFSTISSVSSKLSLDVMHMESLKTDACVQTHSPASPKTTLQETEKIQLLSERIMSLEKELSELREYTKLEQRFSDPFFEYEEDQSEPKDVSKRNLSTPTSLIKNKPYLSYNADDSLGVINSLIYKESGSYQNIMDLNQEMFFNQFNNVIKKLEEVLCYKAKSSDISNPYLKVIFQLFSLTFQTRTTSRISIAKNLSKEIEDMLTVLAEIFNGFSSQQGLGEVHEDLVSRFTNVTDCVLKEIQLSSERENAYANENETFGNNTRVQTIEDVRFNIPDIINVSTSKSFCNPDETTSLTAFEAKESQTDLNEDSDLSQHLGQYQEQISLLREDCDLKEKQNSLFRDKINTQEQIIANLHETLALQDENKVSFSKNYNFCDNSTQTHYFSKLNSLHSNDLDKELNASSRLSNEEFNDSNIADTSHHSAYNTQQFLSLKNYEYFSLSTHAVPVVNSGNTVDMINCLSESKAKKGFDKEHISDSVMTTLSSILRELSNLKDLALKAMKDNMPEAYMGEDVFETCHDKLDLLGSIQKQIKTLQNMLGRIEFFLKDKSDANEHLNSVINTQVDEICSIKSRCSQLEETLKEKDIQFENLNAAVHLFSEGVKGRILQKENLKIDFEEGVTRTGFWEDISFLKNVVKVLEEFHDEKVSSLLTIPEKSMKYTQTVENYPDLAELERVRAFEYKEREDLTKENSLLKLSIKELNQTLEDLKTTLKMTDMEVAELKEKIESMISQAEIDKKNWKIQMADCIRNIEEKWEEQLASQEKEMFDSMDEIKEGYVHQLKEMEENYERVKINYEEKISSLESQLAEEKNNSDEAKLKLENEKRDNKNKVDAIKLAHFNLKNKFRVYTQDVKLKMNQVKSVKCEETQTDSLAAVVKDTKCIMICNECISLKEQIIELKNQAKIENISKPLEMKTSKELKYELSLKKSEIVSLEIANKNMNREIAALKKEINSKCALLRSCNCRLFVKPDDIVKKIEHSSKTNTEEASNKCSIDEEEIRNGRCKNPEDILQLDVVQRAIEKARQEERDIFYRAKGPASDIMNLHLKRQLNKKETELLELKELLTQKPTNASSENKPLPETASRKKVLYSKRPVESSKFCQPTQINFDLNEENVTPSVKLLNPPTIEKAPKVHPRRVLVEHNKLPNSLSHSSEPLKPPTLFKRTEEEKEVEERLQKLNDDPFGLAPSNCKQQ